MRAYVISYLPDDPVIREKRYKAHLTQVEWLRENNVDITVSYRNYHDEFIAGCQYIPQKIIPGSLQPAVGRNQLLTKFYESDDKWALFMDDDAILDPRGQNIIPHMDIVPDNIGVFCPLLPNVPGKGAWKKYHAGGEPDTHWVFERGDIKGSLMFIQNIPERPFFREDVIAGEDLMFGYDMVNLGYASYWCKNMILKESNASGKVSSTWNFTDKDRTEIHKEVQATLMDIYGFKMTRVGLQKKDLFTRNNILNERKIPKKQNDLFW